MRETIDFLRGSAPDFAHGLLVTVVLAFLALPLAVLVGVVFAAAKSTRIRIVRLPTAALVEFLRDTPLLLQIFFLAFGLPLIGYRVSGEACGILAIGVQHGAFLADTFIVGVRSIARVQTEAALSIGMTRRMALMHVVVPQAVIRVLAPVGNQLILAIKDTSVVSGIGVLELTLTGKVVLERTGASFEIFILIGILYILISSSVALLVGAVERWALPRVG